MTAQLRLARLVPDPDRLLLGGTVHYLGSEPEGVTDLEPEALAAHHRRFGARPPSSGEDGAALIDTLDEIALTGRGGGHFAVAAKWRAIRVATGSDGCVVVANGAESEPLSGKDAALLELRPHLVLDGLACAAQALGAVDAVVWLHESAHGPRAAMTRALAERAAARLDEPRMRVALGPDSYLTGESSAVTRSLSGGPALPDFRVAPGTTARVAGLPALVQNVETLARVGIAARDGDSIASTMVTVAASSLRVVAEVAASTRLGEVIGAVLGPAPVQAVLVGGYSGSWVPWAQAAELALTERAWRARGLSLGAGVLIPLREDACGLSRTAKIAGYLADSSARQCGPCLFGLRAVADVLDDLARGAARRRDAVRLQRFLAEVSGRGACHHPDGAVRMIASAVTTFADDVRAHLKGRCLHGWSPSVRHG